MVYSRAIARLGLQLGTGDRRRLYEAIERALGARRPPARIDLGPIAELKLGELVTELNERLKGFGEWKRHIVSDETILGGDGLPAEPALGAPRRHQVQRDASVKIAGTELEGPLLFVLAP